jgi:tetratricopeptide (TPR) repeat protein
MCEWAAGQLVLDDYVVEQKIGEGGMGRVWLVKSNSTGRRFAVKQTKLKDEKSRKAFLAELQTWIDLPEHPNIVPCRFFRTVGDEIVIFTDFIDGGSLKDWIDERKLMTLEQILDVAIQFAWGLHAIHERGLIHQDVKPGNVLMTAEGVPMVADFGLARARQVAPDGEYISPRQPNGQHSVLVPGSGFMTKAYASPEQKAGQLLSRKTDIWSWGVSVLDMFMGGVSCPHGGHIAAEVLESFMSNGGQEEGLPKLPAEMADILRKCFARNLAERWVRLDVAVDAMKDIFRNIVGRTYLIKEDRDNNPAKIVQHDRQGVHGVGWRDPREWLREAYVANGRNPADADSYQVSAAYSRKGAAVAELAIFQEAEMQFKAALSVWDQKIAEKYAQLCGDMAIVRQNLGDTEGMLTGLDARIEIYQRLVVLERRIDLTLDFALALTSKAVALQKNKCDMEGAVNLYNQGISLLRRAYEQGEDKYIAAELAVAFMNKANALALMGDLAGAVNQYDQSIVMWRSAERQEGQREIMIGVAKALMNKANALTMMGDLAGAVDHYSKSIEIWLSLMGQERKWELESNLANAQMGKANALQFKGCLADAMELYGLSIAIYRRLVAQEGRSELAGDMAKALLNKANILFQTGVMLDALEQYGLAVDTMRRLVEQEGRSELANDLALALMGNANTLYSMGKQADAVKIYDESIIIYRRLVEGEARRGLAYELALALMNKCNALGSTGDYPGAIKSIDESIALYLQMVEKEGRREVAKDLANAVMNKANILVNMCKWQSAIKLYDICIAMYQQVIAHEGRGELAGEIAKALMNKAIALEEMGDMHGALKQYDSCILIRQRLVTQNGRKDLLGDLCWVQLLRAAVMKDVGAVSEDALLHAREAYRTLAIEAQRTGRVELMGAMERAQEVLGDIL